MEAKLLLIETSGKVGQVGLAEGNRLLTGAELSLQHKHNRDLAPAIKTLLDNAGWTARELGAVIVSLGPGSYTGLRVGLMSAKTLAYATGCGLIAVETFACLARQAGSVAGRLDVVDDAQRGNVYCQSFTRQGLTEDWRSASELAVAPYAEWLAHRDPSAWATGPGLHIQPAWQHDLPKKLPTEAWLPRLSSLLEEGLKNGKGMSTSQTQALEPLYLRPSSAEEKWEALGRT
jgi:tRNA threonylcarbamoyladenosine biosynthesis protein TsaB